MQRGRKSTGMVKELKWPGPKERKLKAGAAAKCGPQGQASYRSHSRLGTYVNLVLSKDLT